MEEVTELEVVIWVSIIIIVIVIGVSAGVTSWAYRVQGKEKIDELPVKDENDSQ